MIRDNALAASGLLSLKIGGPSVFPPQPEGVWDMPYNDDKWTESKGEDKYRRGLYTFLRRTAPYPSLLTFDGTSRESCTVRRIRTNTPLQALTTLNDPAFFEASEALAKRVAAEGGSGEQGRIVYAFRLCTGRKPKAAEVDRLASGLERERAYFAQHQSEAAKLAHGDSNLAAWTMLSNALLNLDEAITRKSMNDELETTDPRRISSGKADSWRRLSGALASLLNDNLFAETQGTASCGESEAIIFLFMAGAPSQLDLFDYKPKLNQFDGQPISEDIVKGERFAFIKGTPRLLGTPHSFRKFGQSGAELSNLLPHLSTIVDDVTCIKSLNTTQFDHAPAQIFMNTGHQIPGRPSMGSWLSYGIGTENKDLPAFVVLLSGKSQPDGGKSCWSSGFLPTVHQGVEFRRQGDPGSVPVESGRSQRRSRGDGRSI